MNQETDWEVILDFVGRYSTDVPQQPPMHSQEEALRYLTPVLTEAALCFDEQFEPLYRLWNSEWVLELYERLYLLDIPSNRSLSREEWNLLHTDVNLSILIGLNDEEEQQELQQWLQLDASFYGLALRSGLSFLQGDPEQTIRQYEQALKLLRKETGDVDNVIPGIPTLLFALALLQQGGIDAPYIRLFEMANQIEKFHGDDRLASILRILGDYSRVASGDIEFKQSSWLNGLHVTSDPWLALFLGLALYWLNKRPSEHQIRQLRLQIDRAENCSLYWYAEEAAALLNALCISTGSPFHSESDQSKPQLVTLCQQKRSWEESLASLSQIARIYSGDGDKDEKQATTGRRMVWCIQGEGGLVSLEPKEQKLTKKGTWSKGRKVSLKRLSEEEDSFDCLTPADRKICAAIGQSYERSHFYSYYQDVCYKLEGERALRAAIGHPLLYRGDTGGYHQQNVTVEEVSSRVEVIEDEKKGTLQIQMEPYPDTQYDYTSMFQSYWLDQHRLQITEFSDSQIQMAEALTPKGLVAPLSAKEQILSALTVMAPLVTIHSDIGGGTTDGAENIPADTTPHLHLQPIRGGGSGVEMGFHLSIHYKPLGELGPSFLPGEGRAALYTEIEREPRKTLRNLEEEVGRALQLSDTLSLPTTEAPWHWTLDDPEQALELLLALQELGDEIVVAWPQGKKVTLTREIGSSQMQVKMRKQRDWFGISGELQIDEEQVIEMGKLLGLLQQTPGRFLHLDDGRILTLSRQLRNQLDTLHGIRDQGKVHPLATAVVEEATEGMLLKGGKPWHDQLKLLREAESLQPETPTTLQADLRSYQIDGFCWLARLAHWGGGACLADDMGLGKTLQALALIVQRAPDGPTLVIAPTSVCSNWIEEAERFAPTLRPLRFGGGDRQQMLDSAGPYDLIISSYGLLQSEVERISGIEWQTIVADEAQAFKNANTKRSKAVMSLQGGCRIITTGTPIENHLGELWNLFRFINPGLLGSQKRFNERFANPIEQRKDDQARCRLKSLIRPFILRRLKSQVLTELPPKTEITHYVEFNDGETAFYESLRRRAMERIAELPENPGQQRFKVLTEITRLRQAACNPRLVIENSPVSSAKLRAFTEILEELRENRHHALVFSQFVGHLALIREYLDQRGIVYQYLDGSTSIKKRKAAVDAFQRGEGELFLISLKAGGSGLNLTAADYVIHMDPWWNPAVEDQASDRAHRMGQTRPVTIYRLVVKGTIEEKIVALHAHKRDLADGLLEGTDTGSRLSVDDLVDLIKET
ncbi:MAG: DEAD/DEAH box helicase [Sedimenticola sp.]